MRIKFANIETLLQLMQGDEDIEIDNLTWVEPIGIALLKQHKIANPDCNILVNGPSVSYLGTILTGGMSSGSSYTPLVQFSRSSTNIDAISSDVTSKIVSNATGLIASEVQDLSNYLRYLISEMMDNVTSHSGSPTGGFVAAQYYANNNDKVQVVIVDNGVGFKASLSGSYTLESEEEAIKKAMEKAVTGSNAFVPYLNVPKHAGLGLYFLSKILEHTGGRFIIMSNNTIYRSSNDSFQELDTSFKGTMIAFEIYEDKLEYHFHELFNIIKDEGTDYSSEEDVF